ncbi:uncharacterized protein [Triticum aestivum]|uniref:uncharacterized protein isoform X3 n=1 Tax=Triticum aestivum TaxID=4565 RepID=UPI001D031EC8|nr:uncharacterized protein LOC123114100 isoform X3 [Triticum aestivum]
MAAYAGPTNNVRRPTKPVLTGEQMDSGCSLLINSKLLWRSIQACCDWREDVLQHRRRTGGEEHRLLLLVSAGRSTGRGQLAGSGAPVPESRSWKAEAGGGAQDAMLLLLVSAGRSTDGGQLAGSGAPVPESRSWKAQARGGGARAALLLVGAGRSTGGAKARSRGRLEAVADDEGVAYEFGLSIGAEEGGRRGSYGRRGRTPELQQWGGAWRRGGAMEEDEDPRRQEFQIEGSLVLFPVFTWSEKFPNDNYFGTEGNFLYFLGTTQTTCGTE